MYCSRCGQRLEQNISICAKCGADMSRPGSPIVKKPEQDAPMTESEKKTAAMLKDYDEPHAAPKKSTSKKVEKPPADAKIASSSVQGSAPATQHKYPMMGERTPPPLKKKRRKWPAFLCIVLAVIIGLYQLWVLLPYSMEFLANYDAYVAAGAASDTMLNSISYALSFICCAILAMAGMNCLRRLSARRLGVVAGAISSLCFLWNFTFATVYFANIIQLGIPLQDHLNALLYAVISMILCVFSWLVATFLDGACFKQQKNNR